MGDGLGARGDLAAKAIGVLEGNLLFTRGGGLGGKAEDDSKGKDSNLGNGER